MSCNLCALLFSTAIHTNGQIKMIHRHGLDVDPRLDDFILRKALPGTGVEADAFWQGFSNLVHGFAPKNRALLAKRDTLQAETDSWQKAHPGASISAQKDFLGEIGYLLLESADFTIETANVD